MTDDIPQFSTATQTVSPASAAKTSALSGDFETFLKMLTVQMRNQDPMNPIESADFAVQLATFSGVEQQVRTNQLLQSGLGGSSLNAAYADWIGREASAPVGAMFTGAPLTVVVDPELTEGGATLIARNEAGATVSEAPISGQSGPMEWAGVDGNGMPLPDGRYRFSILRDTGSGGFEEVPLPVFVPVTEVRFGADGSTEIVFSGGASVPAEDVIGLRAAR